MTNFHNWMLPLHYGSQLKEHLEVRSRCGMFDVSHMLVTDIKGPDAFSFIRLLLANDIAKSAEKGQSIYSCMSNEEGGIIDDLIAYYFAADWIRIISNAGAASAFKSHIENYITQVERCEITYLNKVQY